MPNADVDKTLPLGRQLRNGITEILKRKNKANKSWIFVEQIVKENHNVNLQYDKKCIDKVIDIQTKFKLY